MSTTALAALLQKLASCGKLGDVAGVVDGMKTLYGSHVGAVVMLDSAQRPTDRVHFGMRTSDSEEYNRYWRPADRVVHAVLKRLAPVHHWQVYREDEWSTAPGNLAYARRLQIGHYMSVPIFGSQGGLVGVFSPCRRPQAPRFAAADLELASTFSGFVSATWSRVASAPSPADGGDREGLTPRELQMARLAARGSNNIQIALELGISRETVKQTLGRVYRKLEANGRAVMTAKLFVRGLMPP